MIAMIIWERAEKGVTLNNCVWHVFYGNTITNHIQPRKIKPFKLYLDICELSQSFAVAFVRFIRCFGCLKLWTPGHCTQVLLAIWALKVLLLSTNHWVFSLSRACMTPVMTS